MGTPNRLDPNTPIEDNLALVNQNFDHIDDQDLTKIINNGTTPTLLLGYQAGGFGGVDYGLKIAKPGFDVTTATNDELIFNSGSDIFKIVGKVTVTATKAAAATFGTASVPHGLSAIPAYLAYSLNYAGTQYEGLPFNFVDTSSGLVAWTIQASVDATNLNVFMATPNYAANAANVAAAWTRDVTFYLLQETAN